MLAATPLRQFSEDGAFAASAVEVAGGTLKADLVDGAQVAEASELQKPWPFSWAIGAVIARVKISSRGDHFEREIDRDYRQVLRFGC